uniref:Uncharacterized protein n=1 Tax=Euplotes crassus TaxID=5936 RepID=A0A7S3P042_EUPCR|mmetsp:Transcript_3553/g.3298  ORF Transcript_3553/g.3298 Transcript_3553/m.3298 type:complete len:230 (+) Transcript_3553:502-1191(+)
METGESNDNQALENQKAMLNQQGRYQGVAQYGQFNGGIQMRVQNVYHQPVYSVPTAFQGYRMAFQQPIQNYQYMPVRYQQVMYQPGQMQANYGMRVGINVGGLGFPGVGGMQARMMKPVQMQQYQYSSNQAASAQRQTAVPQNPTTIQQPQQPQVQQRVQYQQPAQYSNYAQPAQVVYRAPQPTATVTPAAFPQPSQPQNFTRAAYVAPAAQPQQYSAPANYSNNAGNQ